MEQTNLEKTLKDIHCQDCGSQSIFIFGEAREKKVAIIGYCIHCLCKFPICKTECLGIKL